MSDLDLDTRLERLADEATRDAVPPEPAAVARRGRRRRRRQHAGAALLVVAVVAAGLVLPARLTGRTTPATGDDPPAATDLSGAGMLTGHWFGKADVSVYLARDVDAARRQAIRRQLEGLDVVDEVYFESRREAYDRFRELYRTKPAIRESTDPASLPESFRVRLDDPDHFKQLLRALCPVRTPAPASGKPRCTDGIDSVVEDHTALKPVLVVKPWSAISDLTVVLPEGITAEQRLAIQDRLEAIDGVANVTYESPAQAFRALPEKLRREDGLRPKLTPSSLPASFRVRLDEPAQIKDFHRALCGSRRTGDCPEGVVVLEHPRRR
jgi:cell division protein FtsX